MRIENANYWSDGHRRTQTLWIVALTLLVLLVGAFAGLPVWAGNSRGLDADSARYRAMGASYLARSEAAQSERWSALGRYYGQGYAVLDKPEGSADLAGDGSAGEAFVRSVALTGQSPSGSVAGSGPAIGQSVFPGEALARSLAADSERPWTDVAAVIAKRMDAQAGLDADAARYQAMGDFYLAANSDRPWTDVAAVIAERMDAQAGLDADAARYQAMGASYLAANSDRPWTDVAAVIAERMDAQAGLDADAARYQAMGDFYLAAAERGIDAGAARYAAMGASYLARAADADALAVNPELRLARAGYAESFQSIGSCVRADEDRLAANPELAVASRVAGC